MLPASKVEEIETPGAFIATPRRAERASVGASVRTATAASAAGVGGSHHSDQIAARPRDRARAKAAFARTLSADAAAEKPLRKSRGSHIVHDGEAAQNRGASCRFTGVRD